MSIVFNHSMMICLILTFWHVMIFVTYFPWSYRYPKLYQGYCQVGRYCQGQDVNKVYLCVLSLGAYWAILFPFGEALKSVQLDAFATLAEVFWFSKRNMLSLVIDSSVDSAQNPRTHKDLIPYSTKNELGKSCMYVLVFNVLYIWLIQNKSSNCFCLWETSEIHMRRPCFRFFVPLLVTMLQFAIALPIKSAF